MPTSFSPLFKTSSGRLPRACLFDFDMTLADGSPWIVECYHAVLRRNGFPDVDDETVRRTIGLTVEDSFARMTGLKDAGEIHRLRMEYKALCRPQMAARTRFFPDAVAFVRVLRTAGITCGIISTKEKKVIENTLEMNGLSELFTLVLGVSDVSRPKPSPEGLQKALAGLHVSESEAVYFGDSPVDGEAAQRAGTGFVGVVKGAHDKAALGAFPHIALVENYDELLTENGGYKEE